MKKVLVVMFVLLLAVSLLPGCSCGVSGKALQGIQENITALQGDVNALQGDITNLEQRMIALEE
jgi:hypothetical protein